MQTNATNDQSSFTLRGVPKDLELSIKEIAKIEGKSKNQLIVETLEKLFSNPLGIYARTSPLISAIDQDTCKKLEYKFIPYSYRDEFSVSYEMNFSRILNISSVEDVNSMFKRNIPFIELRARQISKRKGDNTYVSGTSLAFSLYVETARRDEKTIKEVWEKIFSPTYSASLYDEEGFNIFKSEINQIRREIGLENI